MKRLAVLAFLLVLAACATPQQQCINRASADYNALLAQSQTVQGNIDRGYAIHTQEVPTAYMTTCFKEDGSTYPCLEKTTRTVETPVAIDVAAEKLKLASLQARLAKAKAARDAAIAQCVARYPE